MSVEESMPLLNYLYRWCERPEVQFRYRMEVGSIAMWDNRAVNHTAVNDYQGYRRECRRIQLKDILDPNRNLSQNWEPSSTPKSTTRPWINEYTPHV